MGGQAVPGRKRDIQRCPGATRRGTHCVAAALIVMKASERRGDSQAGQLLLCKARSLILTMLLSCHFPPAGAATTVSSSDWSASATATAMGSVTAGSATASSAGGAAQQAGAVLAQVQG